MPLVRSSRERTSWSEGWTQAPWPFLRALYRGSAWIRGAELLVLHGLHGLIHDKQHVTVFWPVLSISEKGGTMGIRDQVRIDASATLLPNHACKSRNFFVPQSVRPNEQSVSSLRKLLLDSSCQIIHNLSYFYFLSFL